ncbi:GGDEF domain-containing protein [Bowmanella pacifica]|uniref:diguanylate cyclase n=1 Tax=Bowmanella pacifica TaxID=502051 RepID=A0A917Z4P0_9ALTE|nr:diguanylate cyclase [Bowmanella pacifica]GGO75231.1 GGDEF domain-containing protein [Bowmanella pacifica]
MNYSLLPLHRTRICLVLCIALAAILLSLTQGQLKTWPEISWLDITGEGGVAVLTLVWLFFLFVSRPPGRVTDMLVVGLSCFMFSALLDLLDEFIRQENGHWLSVVESIPAPFGMIMMTWALYQWHQEQLTLNAQLRRREAQSRQHHQVDWVTRLYDADYLRAHLAKQLQVSHSLSVLMLDIDNFDQFNRRYGGQEGDRLLREMSELILMNIRQSDLACRYAGDRFIVLLPDTPRPAAITLAAQIKESIRHFAFKTRENGETVFHTLSSALVSAVNTDQVEPLLQRLNRQLELSRQGS